ncbi:MAG: SemiSWEET transporter [Terracidiphilus sp.]|nr:SemiSWEET transporter [Terracidiphilus sp.]
MVDRWITETIGMAAGICTTTSLAPQLARIWKTKSARDLSLAMFLVFGMGVALWIAYGVTAHSPSVVITNSCSMVLVVSILTLAVRYNRQQQ